MTRRPAFLVGGCSRGGGYALAVAGTDRAYDCPTVADVYEAIRAATTRAPLRIYTAGQNGDGELIQLLADGWLDFRFGAVRNGTILAASSMDGLVSWRNARALLAVDSVHELAAFGDRTITNGATFAELARAALAGTLALFARMAEHLELDPQASTRQSAAGLAWEAITAKSGEPPRDLRCPEAHRGSRCEAYRVGVPAHAVRYDVNSSFAQSWQEAPESDELLHVRVRVAPSCYVGPFFHAPRATMIFPTGQVDTWVFRRNLEAYYEPHGGFRVEKVLSAESIDFGWMRGAAPILADWYAARWLCKRAGDLTGAAALKALLVGAYGKLATQPDVELCELHHRAPRAGHYYQIAPRKVLRFVKVRKPDRKRKGNFPLASWTVDNARGRHYDAIMRAGPRSVLYGDCDAIWTRPPAVPPDLGEGLGCWKEEAAGRFVAFAAKDYEHGGELTRKGGTGGTIWTLRGWARERGPIEYTRERRTEYRQRRVLPGGETEPWRV